MAENQTRVPTRRSVTPGAIRQIAEDSFQRDMADYARARDAQQYVQRQIKSYNPIANNLDPRWSVFDTQLSGPQTGVLSLINKLATKRPRLVRYREGTSDAAAERATAVEVPMNALMTRLYPWRDTVDHLVTQAFCAVTVVPDAASWGGVPDLYEEGETIAPRFRRNKRGRKPGEYETEQEYGGDDLEASTAAYREFRKRYREQYIPLKIEAFGRTQSRALNPRIEGDRVRVDGLIIKRSFRRSHLMRSYIWGDERLLEATASERYGLESRVTSATATLYELWAIDEDGGPFVAYSIDGQETRRTIKTVDGQEQVDAVIDLAADFGLTCLPVACAYGWQSANEDPLLRPIPYPWVFAPQWLTLNLLVNLMLYHGVQNELLGKGYKPDPVAASAWSTQGVPPNVTLEFGKIAAIPGDIVDLGAGAPPKEFHALAGLLNQQIQGDESIRATSAGGPDSAIGQTVLNEGVMAQFGDHEQGALDLYAQTGEHLLEICCRYAEKYAPIVVAVNQPVIRPEGKFISRNRIEIPADLAGDPDIAVYDLVAEKPFKLGDNMAKTQQVAELKLKGLITTRSMLEEMGDPAPEVTEAELEAEKLGQLPVVQMRRLENAARYAGDTEMAAFAKAFAEGKVDEMGAPTALQDGIGQAPTALGEGPGSMTGTGTGNAAESQLAGIVGGGTQAAQRLAVDAAAAGPEMMR